MVPIATEPISFDLNKVILRDHLTIQRELKSLVLSELLHKYIGAGRWLSLLLNSVSENFINIIKY